MLYPVGVDLERSLLWTIGSHGRSHDFCVSCFLESCSKNGLIFQHVELHFFESSGKCWNLLVRRCHCRDLSALVYFGVLRTGEFSQFCDRDGGIDQRSFQYWICSHVCDHSHIVMVVDFPLAAAAPVSAQRVARHWGGSRDNSKLRRPSWLGLVIFSERDQNLSGQVSGDHVHLHCRSQEHWVHPQDQLRKLPQGRSRLGGSA